MVAAVLRGVSFPLLVLFATIVRVIEPLRHALPHLVVPHQPREGLGRVVHGRAGRRVLVQLIFLLLRIILLLRLFGRERFRDLGGREVVDAGAGEIRDESQSALKTKAREKKEIVGIYDSSL